MKRILALLLCLALCLSLLPAGFAEDIEIVDPEEMEEMLPEEEITVVEPVAELEQISPAPDTEPTGEIIAHGECGTDLIWELDDRGTLTISGTGAMHTFMGDTIPWISYRDDIKSIIVSSGVTHIGQVAFNQCINLTSVSLPDGLDSIGKSAFSYCSSLTSITLPNSVRRIDDNAFYYCTNLKSINLPLNLSYLGTLVFTACESLEAVSIPEGITSLSHGTFALCSALKSVSLPRSLTSIINFAFDRCTSLSSITIPADVVNIGYGAFQYCSSLQSINIPVAVTTLNNETFMGCSSLTEISIPESVTSIGEKTFSGCTSLSAIFFYGTAPTIGNNCFYDVTATAFYNQSKGGWAQSVLRPYGGLIEWVPYGSTSDALTMSESSISLPVFEGKNLRLTDANGVVALANWKSSNNSIATVSNFGTVTAHKYGKCTITATANGKSYNCQVQTLFWDVADSSKYYFKHVYWAAEKGITKGYGLEYFAPENNCTREEMMTFLWRMAGKPEPTTTTNKFSDVEKGKYYYKAVLWGVENGITNGYSSGEYAGKFGVGLPCTREQAMTFLWRLAGKPKPKTSTNKFSDVKSSDYFYKAVLWASENGIANGYSSGEYAGMYGVGLACLREHMVTFLSRYYSKFMS